MSWYAYKDVRDLIPKRIIEKQGPDYQGTADYDGDLWYAAADYINELKKENDRLRKTLAAMESAKQWGGWT